jgi:hypothetical protein
MAMAGHVGVFYWIHGELHARSLPWTSVDHEASIISFGSHFSFWYEHVRPKIGSVSHIDHSYYPRGRVYFQMDGEFFRILMDRCIPQEAVPVIKRDFQLGHANVHIVRGPDPQTGTDHYRCEGCDPLNRKKV